jgi:hypothetical protein
MEKRGIREPHALALSLAGSLLMAQEAVRSCDPSWIRPAVEVETRAVGDVAERQPRPSCPGSLEWELAEVGL